MKNEIEHSLIEIWQSLLPNRQIGINDTFIALGGDSLIGIKMISRIEHTFSVRVKLRVIFSHNTIAKLAEYIRPKYLKALATDTVATQPDGLSAYANKVLKIKNDTETFETTHRITLRIKEALFPHFMQSLESQITVLKLTRLFKECEIQKNVLICGENEKPPTPKEMKAQGYSLALSLQQESIDEKIVIVDAHPNVFDLDSLRILVNNALNSHHCTCTKVDDFIDSLNSPEISRKLYEMNDAWKVNHLLEIPNYNFKTTKKTTADGSVNKEFTVKMGKELAELMQTRQRLGTSNYIVLASAFFATLYRYSWSSSLSIWQRTSGRIDLALEKAIGPFSHFIPICIRLHGKQTLHDLFHSVIKSSLSALENQYGYYDLASKFTSNEMDTLKSQKIIFDYQSQSLHDDKSTETEAIPSCGLQLAVKTDLTNSELQINMTYRPDFICAENVDELVSHYLSILQAIAKSEDIPLESPELLDTMKLKSAIIENSDSLDIMHQYALATIKNLGNYFTSHSELGLQINLQAKKQSHHEWMNVFDDIYSGSNDQFAGWERSISREKIPPAEMQEWANHTLKIIKELNPRNILEIGCGTGIIGIPLLEKAASYVGLDVSASAIERFKENCPKDQIQKIMLYQADAHDFNFDHAKNADVFILNSVSQYFKDASYVTSLLERIIQECPNDATIFIGDVRNLLWQIERARALAEDSILDILASETELLISPEYFTQLANTIPQIATVDILLKSGRAVNEMNQYRYDVVIKINKAHSTCAKNKRIISLNDQSLEDLFRTLSWNDESPIIISNVPLSTRLSPCEQLGYTPYQIDELAAKIGLTVRVYWPRNNSISTCDIAVSFSEPIAYFGYNTANPTEDINLDLYTNRLNTELLTTLQLNHYLAQLTQIESHIQSIKHYHVAYYDLFHNIDRVKTLEQCFDTQFKSQLLHEGFFVNATHYRQAYAIITEDYSVTYRELLETTLKYASHLQLLIDPKSTIIAVCMHRSWQTIAVILSILRLGKAYLPLDPSSPLLRIQSILDQCHCKEIITNSDVKFPSSKIITLSSLEVDLSDVQSLPPLKQDPEDTAYILFTSGSTGEPKGVVIQHQAVMNTINAINRIVNLSSHDRILGLSELVFDLSVYDIFATLAKGATLILPTITINKNPAACFDLAIQHEITIWNSVPALFELFIDHLQIANKTVHSLRQVLLSGDWIKPVVIQDAMKTLNPTTEYYSLGGATECSIWSIIHKITKADLNASRIPYGKALFGQFVEVVDTHLQPCSTGQVGEIIIHGAGLSLGYIRSPHQNAERFVHDETRNKIVYKTGDLGQLLENGEIEFLGRVDEQVKLSGYRIDLSEIECHLQNDQTVKRASVIAYSDDQSTQLIAFVELVNDLQVLDPHYFDQLLNQHLPKYMLPSRYIKIKTIPLNDNHKVNKQLLKKQFEQSLICML